MMTILNDALRIVWHQTKGQSP